MAGHPLCTLGRRRWPLTVPGAGRRPSRSTPNTGGPPNKPGYVTTAIGVSHWGAGCTLGDIVAEFTVFGLSVPVPGTVLLAEYLGDYILALTMGIGFQYLAIAPMRDLSLRKDSSRPQRPTCCR